MKLFEQEEVQLLEDIILHRRDVRGNRFIQKEVSPSRIGSGQLCL